MITKKVSKREAVLLLRKYFQESERHYAIGNGDAEAELSYNDKVYEMNVCYGKLRRMAKELKDFDFYSL